MRFFVHLGKKQFVGNFEKIFKKFLKKNPKMHYFYHIFKKN